MRSSPQQRMLFGGEAFFAVADGPYPAEYTKVTTVFGATLLANDVFPPLDATIISVSNFIGGSAVLLFGPTRVSWTQTALPTFPASFDYTIQSTANPAITSTATVTMAGFFPTTTCTDDGPGGTFVAFTLAPKLFTKVSILANDTYGGASPVNPVTVTLIGVPINCTAIDTGPSIQVTAATIGTCSFDYRLTDTITGVFDDCTVTISVTNGAVNAVNDSGIGVTELILNNVSIAFLETNDTHDNPVSFSVVGGSPINCTAVVLGLNVQVTPVARSTSTTCSFVYRLTDIYTGIFDDATVSMNINLPAPVANPDGPGGLPHLQEKLGTGTPPFATIPKATLLANDSLGSQPGGIPHPSCLAPFNVASTLTNFVRCVLVSETCTTISVRSTALASAGSATFQYRARNAQGVNSNLATVTLTVDATTFTVLGADTGFVCGAAGKNHLTVPAGKTLMRTECWGASGGSGGAGGTGGRGGKLTIISNVSPGQIIEYAAGCRGTNGSVSNAFVGGLNGIGGGLSIAPHLGGDFTANGFSLSGSCPLTSDGGVPTGGVPIPVGGNGSSGLPNPPLTAPGGGGGGGAGSVVWFGQIAANNLIAVGPGGGGAGSTATGFGGSTTASGCTPDGRDVDVPHSHFATDRGNGGGGGGNPGGDTNHHNPHNANDVGGPGGAWGFIVGNYITGTNTFATGPAAPSDGRVRIFFNT